MHDKIPVKFTKIAPEAVTPSHGRFGDAGYDLSSLEDVILEPFERKLIKTGIAIELPLGFAALAINLDPKTPIEIRKGDRIAQLIIINAEEVDFAEVDELSETERGSGGFGSSGN